jgi:hypothetical protein
MPGRLRARLSRRRAGAIVRPKAAVRAKAPVIDLGQKQAKRGLLCEESFFHPVLILLKGCPMQLFLLGTFVTLTPSILMVAWLLWRAGGLGERAS